MSNLQRQLFPYRRELALIAIAALLIGIPIGALIEALWAMAVWGFPLSAFTSSEALIRNGPGIAVSCLAFAFGAGLMARAEFVRRSAKL